jgi:hypothetical protein
MKTQDRPDAARLLDGKMSIPAELRTKEFRMLPQWLRERAFYMAGVSRAEILDVFRKEAAAIASGESGMAESQRRIQEALGAGGYQPAPGQEGTIKDLGHFRRIHVSLRTNVQLLQGWGQKERGLRAMAAVPAWELVRYLNRSKIRDWQTRFTRAGGKLTGGRMIALKDSPVWFELGNGEKDSIGTDYPPFAWGSGMGWRGVPRQECEALGILPPGWKAPRPQPVASPNETLETTPRISDRELREQLAAHLKGLARWDKDTLVFTDPNGTRPASPERLAEIWKSPLPAKFEHLPGGGQMQREAFLDWVADSGRFWNDPAAGENKQGRLDWWEDFQRVLMRLEPTGRESQPLYRVLAWNSNEGFSEFIAAVKREGYAAREETPAESWTASLQSARKYGGKNYQVTLKLPAGHSAGRDIAPLVRGLWDLLAKREVPQGKLALTDGEIVLPSWAGLRVKRIGKVRDTAAGKTLEIELEEVPQ